MASVELRQIGKAFGANPVLQDVDLDVQDGEFLTVVGPSGCGKSTLIRIIAGLESQDSGSVRIGGAAVDHLRSYERKVAMVFQNYALYPHMAVFQNMATPLIMARLGTASRLPLIRLLSMQRRRILRQIADEVCSVAAQLQIEALLGRRPGQLSGGQRQRVALGRAMVRHPAVFLMDEPLSNLDAKLRVHMRAELMELHRRLGITFIYVTHDQTEAMTMSDRVAMMNAGRILQVAKPSELYDRPKNRGVAEFIGSPAINVFPGIVGGDGRIRVLSNDLPLSVDLPAETRVDIGLRPESLVLGSDMAAPGGVVLSARLHMRENLGSEQILHFRVAGQEELTAVCRVGKSIAEAFDSDGYVPLHFVAQDCHVFGPDGARLTFRHATAARTDVEDCAGSARGLEPT
jgi:multiple sugar transport system ATP-binding protein